MVYTYWLLRPLFQNQAHQYSHFGTSKIKDLCPIILLEKSKMTLYLFNKIFKEKNNIDPGFLSPSIFRPRRILLPCSGGLTTSLICYLKWIIQFKKTQTQYSGPNTFSVARVNYFTMQVLRLYMLIVFFPSLKLDHSICTAYSRGS